MKKEGQIKPTAENWENGLLGNDEEFAKIAESITSDKADEMLALQMISIRLQKDMIEQLKFIANINGIKGYQPLIRRVLQRFVDCEMKAIAMDRNLNTTENEEKIKA